MVSTDLRSVGGDLVMVSTELRLVGGDLVMVTTDLRLVGGDLVMVSTDFRSVGGDLAMVSSDLRLLGVDLVMVSTDLRLVGGDLAMVTTDLRLVGGDLAMVSTDLRSVGGDLVMPPTVLTTIHDTIHVAGGGSQVSTIDRSGLAHCYGDLFLGDGTSDGHFDKFVDVVGMNRVQQISTSGQGGCVVVGKGDLDCWGSNDEGQVGDGRAKDRAAPVAVAW